MKTQTLRRAATVIFGLAIIVLSLLPDDRVSFPDLSDKIQHFLAYGIWTMLAVLSPRNFRWLLLYVTIIFLTGVIIEILQPLMGRQSEAADILANTLGILLGAGAGHVIRARLYSREKG